MSVVRIPYFLTLNFLKIDFLTLKKNGSWQAEGEIKAKLN